MDPHNNNINNRIIQPRPDETIEARYQLVFKNNVIKSPSFTTDPVKDENGKTIKVEMYDTCTQAIISPDNMLSSAKVRLMVLDAELWGNKTKNLSRSYFDQSVLRARETVGPILKGCSLTIQLENGFGKFQNIYFNDNSSWTRSGFQLAVMVVGEGEGEGEEGYLNGVRVLEGVMSKPFRVKDRHVKASQKPDKLKLTDNVKSIKKVGKDRASNLQKKNIETVEDFLWWYYNKQSELRAILDIKSESDQSWRSMIDHTMTCANEFHAKYNVIQESMSNNENTSQPQQVVFHPMERNMSLSTNGGPPIVSSGSSDPNPCENQTIEGHMPTIYRPFTALCHFSSIPVLNRHISTASGEHIADTQHPLYPDTIASVHPMGNMSFCTNGGPPVVGLGPSESNPGDMPIYVQFSAICDISPMVILNGPISTASGEHIAQTQHPFLPETNASVHPMGRNMSFYTNDGPRVVGLCSSEPNPHESDIIEGVAYPYFPCENPGLSQPEIPDNQAPLEDQYSFFTSLFNNDDVGPQTLCKKRKMKALLRSVTFVTTVVKRKRARIVPPANRTTVPAI